MKLNRAAAYITALVSFFAPIALAHHGKDFLLAESYDIPHPGDVYLVESTGVFEQRDDLALELEPSILVGLVPRVAFELHAHVDKETGEPLRYDATAPSLHLQITDPKSDFPLRVGLSTEYEIAVPESVHDRFEARLIGESTIGRSKLVGNLIIEHERAGDSSAGYAVGYRYDFADEFACGLEGQGSFGGDDHHEVIVGIYVEPKERLTLKGGLGAAITGDSSGFVVRFGVVWQL